MRITYKDENGIYQLDDNYVSEKGIDINGLDDITDYIGELEDLEDQLGCTLEELINGLITKQASLRYFDKYDAKNNHCEVGWYVNMIMYGWVTLQDFINGLKDKSE